MIEQLDDANLYLYHYTSTAVAIEHLFREQRFRFGRYTKTNDPKETKSWVFDLGTNTSRDLGVYKMDELSTWLSSELKTNTRLACFCLDKAPLTGNHLNDITQRGFCKPRMWAQYAANHSGVCLVFNRRSLEAQIATQVPSDTLLLAGKVQYVDRSVFRNATDQQYTINVDLLESLGKDLYPSVHLKAHFQRLFFEKMTDWQDEAEWRYVLFSDSESELYVNLKGVLAGVLFGDSTPEQEVGEIMRLANGLGVQFMGIKWKNCSPWYDYGNLQYNPSLRNSPWNRR